MSKFNGKKTNNARNLSKIKIRELALTAAGSPCAVLEIFCGAGELYHAVYQSAAHYVGIDHNAPHDGRTILRGDYLDCLRGIDLNKFDLIDIDAYGSPYKALAYVVQAIDWRKKARLSFAITDGIQMDLRMGNVESGFSTFTGLQSGHLPGIHRAHDMLIANGIKILAAQTGKQLVHSAFTVGRTGSGMRYYTFTLSDAVVS